MALLYMALQIIRVVVILSILPVLTRGGYGMNYKQIAVLAFGGLRGKIKPPPPPATPTPNAPLRH